LIERISFGLQPISNHYLYSPEAEEKLFPRILSQCPGCGLLQMGAAVPAAELRSPFEWIRYAEPEGHLDGLVEKIIGLTGVTPDHVIYGLSYKDASTLERFRKLGFTRTVLVDPKVDLADDFPSADAETIQALLDEEKARALARKKGRGHVVIARHLLEHVHDLHGFARAIRALLTDDGFFVPEEPDISLALQLRDYSTIWEQRTVFFTPATLDRALPLLGFEPVKMLNYEYPLENALAVIARVVPDPSPIEKISSDDSELRNAERYANDYAAGCRQLRSYLTAFIDKGRSVAMFGGGHMACNFINLHKVEDCFALVVDDDPNKRGLFMPGSRLPVLGSSALVEKNVRHCLLSVRPEIERAIINANASYVKNGGTFASILPRGPSSYRNSIEATS
jgi:hypothetical protein